jgi:hypothetical protein
VTAVESELYWGTRVEWLVGIVGSLAERLAVPAPDQGAETEQTGEEERLGLP